MTDRIDAATLHLGPELDRGGQGRIHPVLDRTGPDGSPLVFKRYAPEWAAQLDADALGRLGDQLADPVEGDWLQARTAWPQTLVEDQGQVTGFLMRAIPDDFRFGFNLGPGIPAQSKISQYAFLLNTDHYVYASGLWVTDRDRLLLLADVADALARFHGLRVAVGDLSPKNMLFALKPTHRTFFIDCDAMQLDGADALPQMHTPDWELPPGETPGTAAADLFKFGLLAIRLLARDQSSRSAAALAAVSPRLGELAVLSQNANPDARPGPEQWIPVLHEVALTLPTDVAPPTFVPQGAATGAPNQRGLGALGLGAAGTWTGSPTKSKRSVPPWTLAVGALVLLFGGVGIVHLAQSSGTISTDQQAYIDNNPFRGAQPGDTTTDPAAVYPTVPDLGATTTDPTTADTTDDPTTADTTDPTTDTPTTDPASPSSSSSVGVVQIDPSIVSDPRAQQVAAMFDNYFSGISAKDYAAVLALYDPNGVLNPNDPKQVQSFEQAETTSSASNVTLSALDPSSGTGPVTTAQVTFQSNQDAGYGPSDNPNETCTLWTLTYTLTYTSEGRYLINQSTGTDTGC